MKKIILLLLLFVLIGCKPKHDSMQIERIHYNDFHTHTDSLFFDSIPKKHLKQA